MTFCAMLRRVKNMNRGKLENYIRNRVDIFGVETVAELLDTRRDLRGVASLIRGLPKKRADAYLIELHAFLATGDTREVSISE